MAYRFDEESWSRNIHRNWNFEGAGGSRDAGPKDGGVVLTGIRPWLQQPRF